MKKLITLSLCCLMLLTSACASACGSFVLIYDSDERLLFEEELRGYHYNALGYILNEMLARHGYHFDPDGKYYEHFRNIDYVYAHDTGFPYQEAPEEISNEEIIAGLSNIEYKNISLIKRIIAEKCATKDESGWNIDWGCSETPSELYINTVGDTFRIEMPKHLKLPVYSGPGKHYLRGAGGRAMVSTDENIKAYGFDGDWLMIAYLVSPDTTQTRVGYVHNDDFRREFNCTECFEAEEANVYAYTICNKELFTNLQTMQNIPAILSTDAVLTDDPAGIQTPLMDLKAGDEVTLLMSFPSRENRYDSDAPAFWAYVEVNTGDTLARGFLPVSVLE